MQALKLASCGLYTSYPNPAVGCVIVRDGKVIGQGYHHKAGQPHAEIMALQHATRSFKGDLSKCSIFVYSEKKDGTTRLTRPCMGCSKMLKDLGVKNIYYTTNNGWQYERRD